MGISALEIDYLAWLGKYVDWKSVRAVCDLGLQELTQTDSNTDGWRNSLNDLARQINPSGGSLTSADVKTMIQSRLAGPLWAHLGIEYRAIDVYDRADCTFLDLNFTDPPPELVRHFDIVLNYGTTEHVCNQWHAFKVIHDLTRPGGWMLHSLPFAGYTNHGLFNYNLKFFTSLCAWNGYELCDAFLTTDAQDHLLSHDVMTQMKQDKPFLRGIGQESQEALNRVFRSTTTGIRVLLKKGQHETFRPALDLPTGRGDLQGMNITVDSLGMVHKLSGLSRILTGVMNPIRRAHQSLRSTLKLGTRLRSLRKLARIGY